MVFDHEGIVINAPPSFQQPPMLILAAMHQASATGPRTYLLALCTAQSPNASKRMDDQPISDLQWRTRNFFRSAPGDLNLPTYLWNCKVSGNFEVESFLQAQPALDLDDQLCAWDP